MDTSVAGCGVQTLWNDDASCKMQNCNKLRKLISILKFHTLFWSPWAYPWFAFLQEISCRSSQVSQLFRTVNSCEKVQYACSVKQIPPQCQERLMISTEQYFSFIQGVQFHNPVVDTQETVYNLARCYIRLIMILIHSSYSATLNTRSAEMVLLTLSS